ncbi:MAG: hypothetical protein IT371_16005 [Deltaproteobacteria bacterium]|nr:hypothetical protein [Deltaproteobacteria bacterium]
MRGPASQPGSPAAAAQPPAAPKPVVLPRPTVWDRFSGLYFNPNYAITHRLDYSKDSGWKKFGRFSWNVGLVIMGIVASTVWHELGHFIMSKSLGVSFKWPASGWDGIFIPLWHIPDDTPRDKRIAISLTGFIFDAVATEVLLWVPQIPKDNLFVVGFLLHSILNNLLYPLVDVIRGGYGDVQSLRTAGMPVVQLHVPLVLHSLLALSRLLFLHTKFAARFNPWAAPKSAGANVILFNW